MKRFLPRARVSLVVAAGLYAMLPTAHALNRPAQNPVAAAAHDRPQALGVAQSFTELVPEPSAWIATLCGVGLLLGLRRVRRAA